MNIKKLTLTLLFAKTVGGAYSQTTYDSTTLVDTNSNSTSTSTWLTFAGSGFQISIVLLTASILAVSMPLFWASLAVGSFASLFMSQGLWM